MLLHQETALPSFSMSGVTYKDCQTINTDGSLSCSFPEKILLGSKRRTWIPGKGCIPVLILCERSQVLDLSYKLLYLQDHIYLT